MAFTNSQMLTLTTTSKTLYRIQKALRRMEQIGLSCESGTPDTVGHDLFGALDATAELFLFACGLFSQTTAAYTLTGETINTDGAMTELLNFTETAASTDHTEIITFAQKLREKYRRED